MALPNNNINTLEKLRFESIQNKVATRVVPYDKSGNTPQIKYTQITTVATKINFPEDAYQVIMVLDTNTTVWLGDNSKIVSGAGGEVFPFYENDTASFILEKGNDNSFYGIVASGTADIYTMGVIKE